jgi:hypothetical protein
MFIKGCINQLCGETPTSLRIGVLVPLTNFAGLSVTPTETQRKAAINYTYQFGQDARKFEGWLEMYLRRFVMLGINRHDSDNAVLWVTSQFSRPLNGLWFNRKL